jgi:hypothetical protein
MTNYVIDWYLDATIDPVSGKYVGGTKVLTTGSSVTYNSDIQYEHPFTGVGETLPAAFYGKYCPIVREIEIGGQRVYGVSEPCTTYCELNTLPFITVAQLTCGLKGGVASTGYDYGIDYSPIGTPTSRNNSFPFVVSVANKYIAIKFTGYAVSDTVTLYYDDGTNRTLLYEFVVGTQETSNNATFVLGEETLRLVIDYETGRVVKNTDYIFSNIEASSATDTA